MAIVSNDYRTVLERSGFDSWYHSLPPKLGIDQFRYVLPTMVAAPGRRPVIVAKEIDRTNLESIREDDVSFVFHTPYFTFDRAESPTDARPDLASAIAEVLDGPAELDPRFAVKLYDELTAQLDSAGRMSRPSFVPPLNCYRVARSAGDELALPARAAALPAARRYFEELGADKQADEWLNRPAPDSLSVLDELMAGQGLDAVLASNPINVQGLSGVPATLVGEGVWALYVRGSSEILVLSRRELPWLGLPDSAPLRGVSIPRLAAGRVGYEELDLTREAYEGLGLAEGAATPASLVFRRWREMLSWADLAFYVIGAQVTVRAIEAALDVVRGAVARDEPVTELDAYERYRAVVAEEIRSRKLPVRVRTYFTHTHGGNRSLIPARATGHSLLPLTSLKIDAGLEIYDDAGSLRAASDVTRSALGSPAALEAYELLDRVLVDVMDGCRPGRTGAEVFCAGAEALEPYHADLVAGGFCPDDGVPFSEAIGRDIGHLLGKQEPATVVFQRGNEERLEPGMVAAAELQWPFRDHCIGVEDVFMTTDAEPLNLTRAAG